MSSRTGACTASARCRATLTKPICSETGGPSTRAGSPARRSHSFATRTTNASPNLDEQLGRLLGELGRRGVLERTWLIITSDHGESFGEQPGFFGHGTSLYQPQLHVPLVIVPPSGSPRPLRPVVPETVSLRDLPATVVDLLGLEAGAPFPGASLAPLWARPPSQTVVEPTGRVQRSPRSSRSIPWTRNPRSCWSAGGPGRRWPRGIGSTSGGRGATWRSCSTCAPTAARRHNRAGDPALQPVIEQMRQKLDKMTAGPLTHERFNP